MTRISKLLGPDGRPIDYEDVFGPPKAGPTLTGVRTPISGHPADGLTPARLASIHRAAATGNALAWLELAEDIEERDPHYLSVLGTRRRAIAQLPINVEAASDDKEHVRHKDFLVEWLKEGVLELALFDILDAIGKGFSVMETEWESTPEAVLPKCFDYRPQRWFDFDLVDGETVVLAEGVTREPLSPHKFIVHKHRAKSGLTIRSGLARVASWSWMYKAFTAKDWAIFTQNYGMPTRVGKFDRAASDPDKEVLWRAVANIAGDCAAIIPKEMEIEFISVDKGTGSPGQLYERRADWLDRQISKLVLGQTTTTDAVSGGHAVAQEHRLVQEDLERADAKLLSASLTRQLVPLIIALNFGPQAKYPRINIGRPDEVPLKDVVDAVQKLGPLGLEVEASEIRDRLGLSEPDKSKVDLAIIGGRQSASLANPASGEPDVIPTTAPKPAPLEQLRHIVTRHASAPEPDLVEKLTEQLAEDAAGAMAGLTAEIRAAFDAATDMQDLAQRLALMQLDPKALAEAMGRGLALANMTGRAALLAEIGGTPGDRSA
jgi:phage gp29-like protein